MRITTIFAFFILPFIPIVSYSAQEEIKSENVAGQFYPSSPDQLSRMIDELMQADPPLKKNPQFEIVIAPHAGYIYSGSIAAHTFKSIAQQHPSTIIVIAPSHYASFLGAAIWPRGGFKTPLGIVNVDEEFSKKLLDLSDIVHEMPEAFDREHALEVELPFIQKTFGQHIKIVPILMGQPDFKVCEQLSQYLHHLMGQRKDILVIVSSDFSHYHSYKTANAMDAGTLEALRLQDIPSLWNGHINGQMEMCGFVPAVVGLMLAKLRGLHQTEIIKYANSGDTTSDHSRVVGYSSVGFYKNLEDTTTFNKEQRNILLHIAREAITSFVTSGKIPDLNIKDATLNQNQGAFVTIKKHGELRGCIGNVIGQKPLAQTVRDMAIAAASEDPRFFPVKPDELHDLVIEISVLSVPVKINNIDDIILGTHGVIVSSKEQHHQGLFLPQVAEETGWSKEKFLSELCSQKAGLNQDCWKTKDISLFTFKAEVFSEDRT